MVNPEHRMVQLSSHLAAADRELRQRQSRASALFADERSPLLSAAAILNFAWAPLDEKYFESIDDDSSMAVGTNAQTEESKRRFSDADIHHRSRIGMLPPPLFSRQVVPHIFEYARDQCRDAAVADCPSVLLTLVSATHTILRAKSLNTRTRSLGKQGSVYTTPVVQRRLERFQRNLTTSRCQ